MVIKIGGLASSLETFAGQMQPSVGSIPDIVTGGVERQSLEHGLALGGTSDFQSIGEFLASQP
jgi:hypothetical protein